MSQGEFILTIDAENACAINGQLISNNSPIKGFPISIVFQDQMPIIDSSSLQCGRCFLNLQYVFLFFFFLSLSSSFFTLVNLPLTYFRLTYTKCFICGYKFCCTVGKCLVDYDNTGNVSQIITKVRRRRYFFVDFSLFSIEILSIIKKLFS